MNLQLWSVGKPHESYIKAGVEDFTGRIGKYYPVAWWILAPIKNAAALSENALKKQEASGILQNLHPGDFLVLLDETGKQLSAPEFAKFLQQRANESTKRVVFLIGGAFGVDESVKQRADFTWSLSRLVFPHMLVRLILAEQVYRACTILRNEKYHHG